MLSQVQQTVNRKHAGDGERKTLHFRLLTLGHPFAVWKDRADA